MKNKDISASIRLLVKKDPSFSFIKNLTVGFPKAEIYLVGGAVRDMMLGRKTKDYDFVVRNIPLSTLIRQLKTIGTVNLVGKKFGVIKFAPTTPSHYSGSIDISLPRTEFSIGSTGHYRDFEIQSNPTLPIEDDLSRRDFTINALAWDIKKNNCIDPFGGQVDLRKKIIRTVGKPSARFQEDYSRVLRAVRFACSLNFQIEEETARAVIRFSKKLNQEISAERLGEKVDRNTLRVVPYEVIAKEMVKAFATSPVRAFDLYDVFGFFKALAPEMLTMKQCPQDARWHSEGDVWAHTRLALSIVESSAFRREFKENPAPPALIFAVMFHDIGKPATIQMPGKDPVDRIRYIGHDRVGADIALRIIDRLRLSSAEGMSIDSEIIHWLIKNHLLLLNAPIATMRNNTIEKYFFKDRSRGKLLLQLAFADGSASIRKDKKSGLETYRKFKPILRKFEKIHFANNRLPRPFLDGNEIMRLCGIKPGPRVGELRTVLREEQLSGRIKTKSDARRLLKENI